MSSYVIDLEEIDQTQVAVVGGKAAHLGELFRIEGILVPAGFCVTTDAFRRIVAEAPSINEQLTQLSLLSPEESESIRTLSGIVRRTIERTPIPEDLVTAISQSVDRFGAHSAYAVRSSATAEDLPTASFAGQQDTYLNVLGSASILQSVSRCWASLFSERAVTYRLRNGFDHRAVQMGVIVQHMVSPLASGVLFTAHPVTSNRKVVRVEASFGLGEALVSGLVNPDVYEVQDGGGVTKTVAVKRLAIEAVRTGGTVEVAIDAERQERPALTDQQIQLLARLGRRIESHLGQPQDIEWCLVDDAFQIVQSRPITTLFPIPSNDDQENHVYLSVGHAQMMTEAIKPLGLSVWMLTTPRPMFEAGGRLFVDVAQALSSSATRAALLEAFGRSDPLSADAMQTILERGDFIPLRGDGPSGAPTADAPAPIETDPAIVVRLIERSVASMATLKGDIRTKSGSALLDFIMADFQELRRILFDPLSHQVFMSAMEATWWLNEQLEAWLGEKNSADVLTHSVPNNITSEMGMALLDVADVIRPHPHVVEFLHHVGSEDFLDVLPTLAGGKEARDAFQAFLDKYGMRCVGEIDITRPRWSERPTMLLAMLLTNIQNFEPSAGVRLFEQGRQEATERELELLARVRALPEGDRKADMAKEKIDRVRAYIGYREYPKYHMISRYFVYKQALLEEAERLVQARVLRDKEDIFYLTLQELQDVVAANQVDAQLIRQRQDAFRSNQALTPPRVLTSDGEVVSGDYRRTDTPPGALVGLAVSAGTVEGRARVIHDMDEADLEMGDILVTAYTDPSWTPAFVAVRGLVTEVGGQMTHGAVIAREYGLPAVVSVERATQLIRDGQQIRVNGTDGYVQILA